MKRLCLSRRKSLWITLSLAAAIGLPGTSAVAAPAEDKVVPAAPKLPAPAEIVEPITPSKAEIPASAFKKLDVSSKGYLSRDDVRGLDGFDQAFDLADPQRTGKLTPAQFKKAWAAYTGH